ncbi:MAG: hypothetical protein ACK5RL_11345 [Acidimicrobiales bacterium]
MATDTKRAAPLSVTRQHPWPQLASTALLIVAAVTLGALPTALIAGPHIAAIVGALLGAWALIVCLPALTGLDAAYRRHLDRQRQATRREATR